MVIIQRIEWRMASRNMGKEIGGIKDWVLRVSLSPSLPSALLFQHSAMTNDYYLHLSYLSNPLLLRVLILLLFPF